LDTASRLAEERGNRAKLLESAADIVESLLVAGVHRVESRERIVGKIEGFATQTLRGTLARFHNQEFVHGPKLCAQSYHVFTPNLRQRSW
jgi:hypothetical protein